MHPELASQTDHGLIAAARGLVHRLHLPTTFVKFLIIGGAGYLINQFFLFLLYDSPVASILPDKETGADFGLFTHPDVRLLVASIVAVELAIVFQFNAHERWTFRQRPRSGWIGTRFAKFNVSAAVSPIISVATINTLTPVFGISPYVSNTVGVALGVAWNWTLNTLVIWPRQQEG